jgi:hypothetical protein
MNPIRKVKMSGQTRKVKTNPQIDLKKRVKAGPELNQRTATISALGMLRSPNFFSLLREALRNTGLAGREVWMGVGVYFIAVSRFQPYPFRNQIQETTEGTAPHIVRKAATLLPPGDLITIRPTSEKKWTQLAESPNGKLVFIPELTMDTENGLARLEVTGDRIIRAMPVALEKRILDDFQEIEGRFACVSGDRQEWSARPSRWLTMRQAKRQEVVPGVTAEFDLEPWHEVQSLLRQRARLPILLPEWEQLVVEEICERSDKAMRHIPTLLQMWRTMCLIQSFQSPENDKATSLQATFEDLAVATLLARKIFREACWFPSCKKLFARLPKQDETRVLHPLTGKAVVYVRNKKVAPVQQATLF